MSRESEIALIAQLCERLHAARVENARIAATRAGMTLAEVDAPDFLARAETLLETEMVKVASDSICGKLRAQLVKTEAEIYG